MTSIDLTDPPAYPLASVTLVRLTRLDDSTTLALPSPATLTLDSGTWSIDADLPAGVDVKAKIAVVYVAGGSSFAYVSVTGTMESTDGAIYDPSGGQIINLSVSQNSSTTFSFSVTDNLGDPLNVAGHEVRFVVFDLDGVVLFLLSTTDANSAIVLGGGKLVSVEVRAENTENPYAGRYRLWDFTTLDPLASGAFTISTSPI